MPTGTISQVRKIIKAKELIEKMQDAVLDDDKPMLSSPEVGAIKCLLNKVIPDLKALEHTGSIDSTKIHKHKVEFVSSK